VTAAVCMYTDRLVNTVQLSVILLSMLLTICHCRLQ